MSAAIRLPASCFLWGPNYGNHCAPCCWLNLWLDTVLQLGDYRHHPYNPNLVPSDSHLLYLLKKNLPGKRFAAYADKKQAVTSWFRQLTPIYSALGYKSRWDKCVSVNGDHVEMLCVPFHTHVSHIHKNWIKVSPSECYLIFWNSFAHCMGNTQSFLTLKCMVHIAITEV